VSVSILLLGGRDLAQLTARQMDYHGLFED
jgi:hypothetical protein